MLKLPRAMYMSPEKLLISSSARGYELTVKKELSQPGQFASNERVAVIR